MNLEPVRDQYYKDMLDWCAPPLILSQPMPPSEWSVDLMDTHVDE